MLRFVNICLVLALVALAYVIYEGKYEARALDEDIGGLRKEIETERDGVAVLRAEWSLLNRPERIERLAKKHLKLNAARPQQLVTIETVSDSDFERVRMEAAVDSLPAGSAPPSKVKSVAMPGQRAGDGRGPVHRPGVTVHPDGAGVLQRYPPHAAVVMPMPGDCSMPTTRLPAPAAAWRGGVSSDAFLPRNAHSLSRQGLSLPHALIGAAALAASSK